MMKRTSIILFVLMLFPAKCAAQRVALSTNIVEWADLLTINGEVSVAVHRNVSLILNGRYNPWSFHDASGEVLQNRKLSASLGFRYWPWFVNSGWWLTAAAQGEAYNRAGLFGASPQEGFAVGGALGFGYSLLITPHFNIDFGASVWLGKKRYTTYDCPVCGRITGSGTAFFILPDDVRVSAVYVF